jgi:hypothetical protein
MYQKLKICLLKNPLTVVKIMSVEFEGRKRIRLDDDEEVIEAVIRLPRSLYDGVKAEAKIRGISTASFVRDALMKALKVPAEIGEEISDLLESCSVDEDNFEIEGVKGFLANVSGSRLKGDVWTPRQLDKVAEKLVVGYHGYVFPPTLNDLIDRVAKAMKLNEHQKDYLARALLPS